MPTTATRQPWSNRYCRSDSRGRARHSTYGADASGLSAAAISAPFIPSAEDASGRETQMATALMSDVTECDLLYPVLITRELKVSKRATRNDSDRIER